MAVSPKDRNSLVPRWIEIFTLRLFYLFNKETPSMIEFTGVPQSRLICGGREETPAPTGNQTTVVHLVPSFFT